MNNEIAIRRALTDQQFGIAKALLALDCRDDDLFRAALAIMAASINHAAPDAAAAKGRAGEYCAFFLNLVDSGRVGQHLIYERGPRLLAFKREAAE